MAEHDVVGDRERRDETEFLRDHHDPGSEGGTRIGEALGGAI